MKSVERVVGAGSASRISLVVYASLTLLAATAAASAKGYLDSMGELVFVVLVTAVGLVLAHFWASALAFRMSERTAPGREWLRHEAVHSSTMILPGLLLAGAAWLGSFLVADFEVLVTIAMSVLLVALFAYTWVGTSRIDGGRWSDLLWAAGTAAVGLAMIIFKVLV